jgi:hypothetical protein
MEKERKTAQKVIKEKERGCTEWINADGTAIDEIIPVANEQRQVTVNAEIRPSVNSALVFGQSEFEVISEEGGKRVVQKRKEKRPDDQTIW